jgi:hypothetical protein
MAMSQAHKEALARGRKEARAIKAYLDELGSRRRGRPVTESGLKRRLEAAKAQIPREGNALRRVELTQKRLDLEKQLRELGARGDRGALERGFVRYAASYSSRKGITYPAWREAGVPAAVLAKAGIKR